MARKPAGPNRHALEVVWPPAPPVKSGTRAAFTAARSEATSTSPSHRSTTMPPETDLAILRAEIDRIDDRLVDLLVERIAVVRRIAAAKGDRERGGLALRPAREAAILRRLVGRAGGRLPAATLVRMWRELLATTTRLQTPLSIAVWAPPEAAGVWDVARDQFGSATPAERASSAVAALDRASRGTARIAVLPMPEEGRDWWPALLEPSWRRLAVIARLPFVEGSGPAAIALAPLEPEPSRDDLSLLVLEVEPGVERTLLAEPLERAGLAPSWHGRVRADGRHLHLVEVRGFHGLHEPFPTALFGALGDQVRRTTVLGAYPRPITADGLSPAADGAVPGTSTEKA